MKPLSNYCHDDKSFAQQSEYNSSYCPKDGTSGLAFRLRHSLAIPHY
jgi:hypothetical protein